MDCNMRRLSGQVVGQIAVTSSNPLHYSGVVGPLTGSFFPFVRFAEGSPLTTSPYIHPCQLGQDPVAQQEWQG
jgi:hypothetical protein